MRGEKRAEKGELLFGTVETWLIWNLTGGKVHVTDYTNASRTMLFDIHKLCWDKQMLEALLPELEKAERYIFIETFTFIYFMIFIFFQIIIISS